MVFHEANKRAPSDHEGASAQHDSEAGQELSARIVAIRDEITTEALRALGEDASLPESLRSQVAREATIAAARIEAEECEGASQLEVRRRNVIDGLTRKLGTRLTKFFGVAILAIQSLSLTACHQEVIRSPENQVDISPPEVDIDGLDPEITPERVRAVLDTLPKGWVDTDVRAIRYSDAPMSGSDSYGISGSMSAARSFRGDHDKKTSITFFSTAKEMPPHEVLGHVLIHEIAHANDFMNDNQFTQSERQQLLDALRLRVKSPDRLRSPYVESIHNEDARLEGITKAREYWGEIAAEYFASSSPRIALSPADVALIETVIQKTDPAFDQHKAKERRDAVLRPVYRAWSERNLEEPRSTKNDAEK